MSGSLLLVEDDSAIATVITAALEDEGFDITRVASIADRDARLESGALALVVFMF